MLSPYPLGTMQMSGFDRMKDGESITLRITKHIPVAWQWPFTLTSEIVEDPRAWVLEP